MNRKKRLEALENKQGEDAGPITAVTRVIINPRKGEVGRRARVFGKGVLDSYDFANVEEFEGAVARKAFGAGGSLSDKSPTQ